MGVFVTLNNKGQFTLPKEMRVALGLEPGDAVALTVVGERLVMTPKSINFNDLRGMLGEPPNGPATLEEIDDSIARAGGTAAVAGSSKQDAA